MRSKYCKDRLCDRAGELIPLDDFPRNSEAKDKRYLFCKECCRRRTRELRESRGYKPKFKIVRKPVVYASSGLGLSKVYDAIRSGFTTREQIQKRTQLDYETIGLALCELLWEAKAIRIKHREFVLIDSDSEREELEELRREMYLRSLGEKSQSIAVEKLRRLIELEAQEILGD